MLETLTCSATGHEWSRERTRGRKPQVCPEHSSAVIEIAIHPELSKNYAPSEQVRAILASEKTDPELSRKLRYTVAELSTNRRTTADQTLLLDVQDRLIEYAERKHA